jgi:hypothetical protein
VTAESGERKMKIIFGRSGAGVLASLAVSFLIGGCSLDGILKSDELPPNVRDPAITRTPEGALAAYYGARAQFAFAFGTASLGTSFVGLTGVIGDELNDRIIGNTGVLSLDTQRSIDVRQITELETTRGVSSDIFKSYSALQGTRGQTREAIGLVTRFAPPILQPLAGHLHALLGFTEVFLAELFCSGVPLSTVDFDGDFTARAGSSTEEVYAHAIALFDSALALAGDSTRFADLARIGKARALLGLGDLAQAAAIAAQVPDGYRYDITFAANPTAARNFAFTGTGWAFIVADREGVIGLDYRTSNDPRTRVTARGTNGQGFTVFHPNKYAIDGSSPIVLASGVEARLIEAEAALQTGGSWLDRLNALRTNGAFTTAPNPTDPTRTDTTWNAGTGGTAGLRPLADPGTPESRVDLVFRERAFWLFLTGQRQGDLRRLVRNYGRESETVYPSGAYPGGHNYGGDINLPIPGEERANNPNFNGCLSRDA